MDLILALCDSYSVLILPLVTMAFVLQPECASKSMRTLSTGRSLWCPESAFEKSDSPGEDLAIGART